MKSKLTFLISLLVVCIAQTGFSQDPNELILQMAQQYPGGTARMMGIGGSKVSLGGDMGNIYLNPAGLGFYNRSEFVFTPQFDLSYANTDYLDQSDAGYKLNFNIANLGVVFNKSKDITDERKWRGGSWSFSLNRINDYHFNANYSAYNTSEDIIDFAVDQDNFTGPTDLSDLIYNTGLTGLFYEIYEGQDSININGYSYDVNDLYGESINNGDTLYFVDRNIYRNGDLAFPTAENPTLQSEEIRSSGSQYAASFSYGGNYNDRFYFGVGVNLMSINKRVERTYISQPSAADLTQMTLTDTYNLNGSGLNVTLGLIGRPISNILVGFSYTTPTYYTLEESQDIQLVANYTTTSQNDYIVTPSFIYDLSMPSRVRGGITYFFGKSGFLTADIESVKSGNAKILNSGDPDFENDINNITSSSFKQVVSAGVGGEYRMGVLRLRAGVNYITDPLDRESVDFNRYLYSVGVGIRKKHFFFDVAYTGNEFTQLFRPYPTASAAEATIMNNYLTSSIGFNF